MNDTAYNQAYDAKMAEYKKEYAGLTAKEITDETRKRNEILAKEIYLSVGRYKLRKKSPHDQKAARGIQSCNGARCGSER